MQLIEKTPEKLILRMDMNYSLANAIRRSIDEVLTLAVDEVEIFKNDSALYDEVISHRIGMIPLKTEKNMGSKTSVDLKLVKTGPCSVYSGDFKSKVKIVYDSIPLTILEKGQEIELIATAKIGKGLEHAKHSAGLCYYKNILEVKSTPQIDKIVESLKSKFKSEKRGSKWICDLEEAEVDEILKIDKNAINDSGDMLLFIESWGQLASENILKEAIKSLKSNLADFEKALK